MLEDAAARWNVELAASYVIGDRWRDIGAGRNASCYSILIERPYSDACEPHLRVQTLGEAVDAVLGHAKGA
jgi:D-glycero-D-manno-heptose 1,7-bisphosphate phosphatase